MSEWKEFINDLERKYKMEHPEATVYEMYDNRCEEYFKLQKLYEAEKEKNRKAIEYIKTHKHFEGHTYRDVNDYGKLVIERAETTLVSGTDLLKILEENK